MTELDTHTSATSPSGSRGLRTAAAALAAILFATAPAAAQQTPVGGHHAGPGSSAGSGSVAPTGGFGAAIPLDLPPARGAVPLPLGLAYNGGARVGEGGVGWSVAPSYVARTGSFDGKRPSDTAQYGPPEARDTVTLVLQGQGIPMIEVGPGRYRPMVDRQIFELVETLDGWTLHDGTGYSYSFLSLGGGLAPGLWYLRFINDRTHANPVELRYEVAHSAPGAVEVLLTEIEYNRHPTRNCYKNAVHLVYQPDPTPSARPVLGYHVAAGELRARTEVLYRIDVMARGFGCSTALERLRRYELTYEPDADTGLPRLVAADLLGRIGTPEADERLPLGRFAYGTATSDGVLIYERHTDPQMREDIGQGELARTDVKYGVDYETRKSLIDMTGDGRPDWVHADPFGTLQIARSTAFGTVDSPQLAFNGSQPLLPSSLADLPLERSQATAVHHHGYRGGSSWSYSKVQTIDFNGDGRMDILALGRGDDTWTLHLNTPVQGDPAAILWQQVRLDVSGPAAELEQRGLLHDEPLYLSRSVTGNEVDVRKCWLGAESGNSWTSCTDQATRIPHWQQKTFVEWRLQDINGDGYPDLMSNSRPYDAWRLEDHFDDCGDDGRPTVDNGGYDTRWCNDRFRVGPPAGNELLVFYNKAGATYLDGQSPFTAPVTISSDGAAVEEWASPAQELTSLFVEYQQGEVYVAVPSNSPSTMHAGLLDVNGDGIADRIPRKYGTGAYPVRLGTGGGFVGSVTLPGPPAVRGNSRQYMCDDAPADTEFSSWWSQGLVDLTGDGILDYVYRDRLAPDYSVHIGTGAGWSEVPTPIDAGGAPFWLSRSYERCGDPDTFAPATSPLQTTDGIFDLDGDGKPDLVAGTDSGLAFWSLRGGSGVLGARDAGRLIRGGTGYGSYQHISYVSAKDDWRMTHQVPVPEIVVDRTATHLLDGPDVTIGDLDMMATPATEVLAPTRYAYGGAWQRWDPARDRFVFMGYRRTVQARGAAMLGFLRGAAAISERQIDSGSGYDSLVSDGRLRATYALDGLFLADVWGLLALDVGNDGRWHGGTSITHAIGSVEHANPLQHPDCTDDEPYSIASIVILNGNSYDAGCRTRGYGYARTVDSWTGTSAPTLGGDNHVATRRTIQDIDDYGRPGFILHENDVNYGPDDVCEEIGYADAADGRMLASRHYQRLYRCGGSGRTGTMAGERYLYDGSTQEGVVNQGFVTRRIVERYDLDSGAKLEELAVDDTTWGPGGVLLTVSNVTVSKDPLTDTVSSIAHTEEYQNFDPFVIAPGRLTVTSNDGVSLAHAYHLDAHTLAPTAMTDPNGTTWRSHFDGFFRPVADTVTTSAGEHVLGANEYLGFGVGDSGGRRLHNWSFHAEVPAQAVLGAASIGDAIPADSAIRLTGYLDPLGRPTHQEQDRGSDYADPLILARTSYDELGRPTFVADPYPASETGAPYGTSYRYRDDGSVRCQIRGRGQQSATTTSNSEARFPTCTDRIFDNYRLETRTQGPNERLSGSPHQGGYESAVSTAIGWTLERSRWEGSRVEASRYTYDPLGNLRTMVRYGDPQGLTEAVTWKTVYDSLGQLVRLEEPATATRHLSYDGWGNQIETRWLGDGGLERLQQSQYDAFGRLVRSVEKKNGQVVPDSRTEYFYDESAGPDHKPARNLSGRLSHAFSPGMELFFSYDELGRTESQLYRNDAGIAHAQDFRYGLGGQLEQLSFRFPTGGQAPEAAFYTYDSALNVAHISWLDDQGPRDLFKAIDVDALGRYRQVRYGNGVQETWGYQGADRRELTEHQVRTQEGRRYTGFGNYDGDMRLGQRVEYSDIGGYSYQTTDYQYDAAYRLSRYQTTSYGSTLREEAYSYDGLGNLRQRFDAVDSVKRTFTPSATDRDRLCTYGETAATQPAFDTRSSNLEVDPDPSWCHYKYDALGNVRQTDLPGETTRTFQYDGQSRITRLAAGGAVASYRYGPLGGITHLDSLGTDPADTREDRRFGGLVEESIFAVDSSTTRVVERRVPGPFGLLMSRRGFGAGAETLYAHGDDSTGHLRTNADGLVVQSTELDPFGATLSDTGQPGTDTYTKYLFNGGDTLGAFDLTHIGARLYDPKSGRFLQRDPLYIPRTSSTTHPYAFAWSDPINFADPTGMDPSTCQGKECTPYLGGGVAAAGAAIFDYFYGSGGGGGAGAATAPVIVIEAPTSMMWSGSASGVASISGSNWVSSAASGTWDVTKGMAQGAFVDLPYGAYQAVRHPVRTVKGAGNAIGSAGGWAYVSAFGDDRQKEVARQDLIDFADAVCPTAATCRRNLGRVVGSTAAAGPATSVAISVGSKAPGLFGAQVGWLRSGGKGAAAARGGGGGLAGGGAAGGGGGAGASAWTPVSRWLSPEEAAVWSGRSSIPQPRGQMTQVTRRGAARPGAASDKIRIDFQVPTHALRPGGTRDWYNIFNEGRLLRASRLENRSSIGGAYGNGLPHLL